MPMKSQNGLGLGLGLTDQMVGRDPEDHLVPCPAMGRDTFHQPSLLQTQSRLALDTSRDGTSMTALGHPVPASFQTSMCRKQPLEILGAPAEVQHSQVSGGEKGYLAVALSPSTLALESHTHSLCVFAEDVEAG